QRKWFIISSILFGLFTYGSLNKKSLKWETAFQLNNSFTSYLALNPFQNFFATLQFRSPENNVNKARQSFSTMAGWMNLNDKSFNYKRTIVPQSSITTKPNVVLVLCESFSMYKSSMSGNKLNTTPYFNSLTNQGIFFDHCFTPHFSTARGLFALLTGIPDVQLSKFSTRNPEALDQHTIVNDFEGYKKFYFLGGDPSFNNFEGLVKNIDGLQMDVQGSLGKKPVNVWG